MDRLFERLMENEPFRVRALRFVDVLPALKGDVELVEHLGEYFGEDEFPLPGLARWGLQVSGGKLAARVVAPSVRKVLELIGKHFLGGRDATQMLQTAAGLRQRGFTSSLDLLGEATVSEAEAERYLARYLGLLSELAPAVRHWPNNSFLDASNARPAPRLNLSVKVSSLYSQATPRDPEGSMAAIAARLRPLLQAARDSSAFILLDMEHYDLKDLTLGVLRQLLLEDGLRDWPDVGIALQAYLKEAERDLAALIAWAKARGTPVTVRLVRGAYWDAETVIARRQGWPVPVWMDKGETDACYERCLRMLFAAHPHIEAAVATHNPRSIALAQALAEHQCLDAAQFEFQTLYGMAEPLRDALVRQGYKVRVYTPFGDLLPGMAYLVRRLLENAGSQSLSRLYQLDRGSAASLLAPPVLPSDREDAQPRPLPAGVFHNEPVHRFVREEERQAFAQAIDQVRGALGRRYPLLIDGQARESHDGITSINPARSEEVIGVVARAGAREAEAAIAAARRAFPDWAARTAEERATLLERAATALRARRDEFAVWEIFEAGKPWAEADADVAEAIDFLAYYAEQARRLSEPYHQDTPGESNGMYYAPRGVAVVIPPWNFPLAILTGMLSAAVVCGNTVVLKPSSQTPVIAARFVTLLHEIGLPLGVVNFLPGSGSEVGDFLVGHPHTHVIAFTGSREVGTHILRLASEVSEGQNHIKRVIAEMGGKNAIIIDSDADLDDAVPGVISSAFGYQGQKCSACSRAIVVGDGYEAVVERLVEAARSLRIGFPEAPGTVLGPVIEAAARERIQQVIERGCRYARRVLHVNCSDRGEGFFIGPTIFADVPPDSELAQEEVFGPVLSVIAAGDFDQALHIANGTRYALTGGVYSRSPAHLEKAQRAFHVGNLYLNRKITGAWVGRQPFGGFKLSGIGSKAGGPDYLLQFVEPRTVTENTLRKGFAPAF